MKSRAKRRFKFGLLLFVGLILLLLAWPREDLILGQLGIKDPLQIKRGLDLRGGVYLVYEAKLDQLEDKSANKEEVLNNARHVIERRINPGGAGEAIVQTAGGGRIVVQIPSVDDPAQAISTIGKTAKLEFFEVSGGGSGGQPKLAPTEISGSDVQRATVEFGPQSSQPVVNLQLKGGDSTDQFAALTTRLAGSQQQLVTMLDGQVVFGPAGVQNPITDGVAQLSGSFNARQAKEIADLLNAGALPVPIELTAQQTIGPTLGEQSVKDSIIAAAIGLGSVMIFLILYYRRLGGAAVGALIFYSLALLSLIKLSSFTPYVIVLTLAGIAGFILSIAAAVDANVLIMERIKEELKDGSSPVTATIRGIEHAWTSIRDANITTIIGALILYIYGAPLIKGFALTLGVGIALNLICVQTVSKVLMTQMARGRLAEHPGWAGRLPKGSNKG